MTDEVKDVCFDCGFEMRYTGFANLMVCDKCRRLQGKGVVIRKRCNKGEKNKK